MNRFKLLKLQQCFVGSLLILIFGVKSIAIQSNDGIDFVQINSSENFNTLSSTNVDDSVEIDPSSSSSSESNRIESADELVNSELEIEETIANGNDSQTLATTTAFPIPLNELFEILSKEDSVPNGTTSTESPCKFLNLIFFLILPQNNSLTIFK